MKYLFCIIVLLSLFACSSDKEEHFLSSQEKALEKSKEVQSAIDEQAEKLREKIQQQE
ncbi:MAG: hypothetical protein OEZ68_16665 [Gammaproteobacteria bacterium]|nr:hypothetical protein [Gammaproteobacteria bacterium]MDH5802436.1 hypothetical protein [Gammaproteobacteria bacterium]